MPIAIKRVLERLLFASRWLMLPFYLGLVVALADLIVVFIHEIIAHFPFLLTEAVSSTTLWVLELVDMSLVANLLLIVILAGYENFVSRMPQSDHPDWPGWVTTIDFSGMKMKLIGSITAIASIYLLEVFLRPGKLDPTTIGWLLGIQAMIIFSGVMLAVMDYIAARSEKH
ncbi:MAG TPA: YqhA family protein [Rhizomicrobium sp.]|nr:YqhA family protein [Rhizomicrobium sp.]